MFRLDRLGGNCDLCGSRVSGEGWHRPMPYIRIGATTMRPLNWHGTTLVMLLVGLCLATPCQAWQSSPPPSSTASIGTSSPTSQPVTSSGKTYTVTTIVGMAPPTPPPTMVIVATGNTDP